MPAPTEVAQAHYAARQALITAAAADAARRWATVDPQAIPTTWQRGSAALAVTVAGAQLAAAQQADPYVQAALPAESVLPATEYAVAAGAFAGVAADGRDLVSLLYQPAIVALVGIQGGQPVERSLAAGYAALDTMVRTEVADAGREADLVANTAHGVDGYIRHVVGATCNRCIILAGRWYRYSAGFQRHPRCDCVMVPAAEGEQPTVNPEQIYRDMTPTERSAAGWSQAEQEALNLGADIAQVTNVHRKGSIYVAGGRQYTRESTSRRGASPRTPRPTLRQIFADARGDRGEAVRLLKRFGYLR